MKLGIIAEDYCDVDVLKYLTLRLLHKRGLGFKCFVGKGCGKLKRKCRAWAEVLVRQGCKWVAVIHDLDTNDEQSLRCELAQSLARIPASGVVVLIPVHEIESWLMYDANAIRAAFRERLLARLPGNPESLNNPKRTLGQIIWTTYRKRYLNTVHNPLIAKTLDPALLSRARSFAPHPPFVNIIKREMR